MFGGICNVPFIYLPLMLKSFFRYQKIWILYMCKCGAVVECKARDLGGYWFAPRLCY
jgi:hypothetical protein